MQFHPKTEEEIAFAGLLPEGIYPFTVSEAVDAVSKNGNDMIRLTLIVHGDHDVLVRDYLLPKLEYKLYNFCKTTGLLAEYESGTIHAHSCVGRVGYAKVKIEKQDGYSPRNSIGNYSKGPDGEENKSGAKPAPAPAPPALAAAAAGAPDDDIPF